MNSLRSTRKFIFLLLISVFLIGFMYQYNVPTCLVSTSSLNLSKQNALQSQVQQPSSGGDPLSWSSSGKLYSSLISDSSASSSDLTVTPINRAIPLIFIGGMPRSGTTLLRVILDAHPDVRCGEETRVIPRLLGIRAQWMKSPFESRRLQEAGITPEVLDSAISAFILEIVGKHGPPAQRLCNKDPFTLRSAVYLKKLFPNSKFIFMIRDGRAVVHSIITRKVTISGFDLTDYRQCMKKWNSAMQAMHNQCETLGPSYCLPVYYEQMVLQPELWLRKILQFLDVPWNDSVLNHEKLINKPGGISLSKLERSTDQVIKPINVEALSKWVGHMPEDVVRDMGSIAPMLSVLGYDPSANPPDYGKPDAFVVNKMKDLSQNRKEWEEKEKELLKVRQSIQSDLIKQRGSSKGLSREDSDNEIGQSIGYRLTKEQSSSKDS
ncbi:protein-tyrosine sulfotransferase 2-like [Panonychus citri]|uniref:protein-tyrosine sulfotransferase 2-like n=1 Tax=Panonychus citri TaxID=50023 RepID=UPI002306F70A|nr:protein-tyrosine sulfotransferase 2-like [Panonychus citri]